MVFVGLDEGVVAGDVVAVVGMLALEDAGERVAVDAEGLGRRYHHGKAGEGVSCLSDYDWFRSGCGHNEGNNSD